LDSISAGLYLSSIGGYLKIIGVKGEL